IVALIGGSVLGTGGAMFAAYNYFATDLPAPNILDDIQLPQSTLVYDRTDKVLLARFECQNRESVAFKDVPKWIVDATVATEDKTFWSNSGVDVNATIRAFLANAAAGHIVQGASTITQQVIKYAGSIKEAQAKASPASPLPSAQAQAEAQAQAQAKTVADVCKPPELTFLNGRGYVDKIKENILALQVTAAYPGLAGKQKILATYLNLFVFRVEGAAEEILAMVGYKNPAHECRAVGSRVVTTLVYGLQQTARPEVLMWVNQLKPKNVHHEAMVALNAATGEVVAYVGSGD